MLVRLATVPQHLDYAKEAPRHPWSRRGLLSLAENADTVRTRHSIFWGCYRKPLKTLVAPRDSYRLINKGLAFFRF
jgi:hypothetical protein